MFVLLNMFIAIISEAYEDAKEELEELEDMKIDTLGKEIWMVLSRDFLFKIPGAEWLCGRAERGARMAQKRATHMATNMVEKAADRKKAMTLFTKSARTVAMFHKRQAAATAPESKEGPTHATSPTVPGGALTISRGGPQVRAVGAVGSRDEPSPLPATPTPTPTPGTPMQQHARDRSMTFPSPDVSAQAAFNVPGFQPSATLEARLSALERQHSEIVGKLDAIHELLQQQARSARLS